MDLNADLSDILMVCPGLRLYQPSDDPRLFDLFKSQPMRTSGLDLVYDRTPIFSQLLKCQARQFRTFVLENDRELIGLFSLSWGPRYVNGEVRNVGYLGDFRIRRRRDSAAAWRKFYCRFLENLNNLIEFKIDYCLTGMMSSNLPAISALVKNGSRNGFHYHPLSALKMINCIARKPSLAKNDLFSVEKGSRQIADELIEFLDASQKEKLFGYVFKGPSSEWSHREESWPGWAVDSFLLIRDSHGRIVACTLPWSPSAVKRMRIENASPALRIPLRIGHWAGLHLPQVDQTLDTLYLTHLEFSPGLEPSDRAEMVHAFAKTVFLNRAEYDFHLLAIADQHSVFEPVLRKHFLCHSTPIDLYQVSHSPESLFVPNEIPVGFEMALV